MNYRIRSLSLLMLLILGMGSSIACAEGAHKWALLIGINRYQDETLTRLNFADSDARTLASSLIERAGFEADHVITMASDDGDEQHRPTRPNILHRLSTLADLVKPGDTFLFYFSGHGFSSADDTYLATMDAQVKNVSLLEGTALPVSLLQKYVADIHATQRVFIVDACREDPNKQGKGAQDTRTQDFSKRIVAMAASGLDSNAGTAVLFACKEGQLSYEYPDGRQGAFTFYLLKALNSGRAVEADGSITPYSLISYVQEEMAAWSLATGHDQVPDFHTDGKAKIVLARTLGPNGGNVVTKLLTAVLIVHCDAPGATITIDGKEVGSAPHEEIVDLSDFETKKLTVRITAPSKKAAEYEVTLERGKTTTVDSTLDPIVGPPIPHRDPPILRHWLMQGAKPGRTLRYSLSGTTEDHGVPITATETIQDKILSIAENGNLQIERTLTEAKIIKGGVEESIPDDSHPVMTVFKPNGEIVEILGIDGIAETYRMDALDAFLDSGHGLHVGEKWTHEFLADSRNGNVGAKGEYEVMGEEMIGTVETIKVHGVVKETSGATPASAEWTKWIDKSDGTMVKCVGNYVNIPSPDSKPSNGTVKILRIEGA